MNFFSDKLKILTIFFGFGEPQIYHDLMALFFITTLWRLSMIHVCKNTDGVLMRNFRHPNTFWGSNFQKIKPIIEGG